MLRAGRAGDRDDRLEIEDRVPPLAGGRSDAAPPDITLAKAKLGWEPEVPLREGLKKTIAYFDQLLRRLPASAFAR